jgi:hypothetical protein
MTVLDEAATKSYMAEQVACFADVEGCSVNRLEELPSRTSKQSCETVMTPHRPATTTPCGLRL